MLEMVHGLGADPLAEREAAEVVQAFPFSSDRKRMSTLVRLDRCVCGSVVVMVGSLVLRARGGGARGRQAEKAKEVAGRLCAHILVGHAKEVACM